MAEITKRLFNILDLTGQKFLEWKEDAIMNLEAQGLEHTVIEVKEKDQTEEAQATKIKVATNQEKAKALVLLRHHIHDSLKSEYLFIKDPKTLWDSLVERFDHHKRVLLPQASHEWKNLRFSDFKTLSEYNSTLYRIASMLKYCEHPVTDAEMIELTLSTFHPSNIILQQQYRERNFKRYSDLSVVLSLAEQHNDLVWKNHNMRPIGSQAIRETHSIKTHVPEAHAVENKGRGNYNNRGRGRGNFRGKGRGRGQGRGNFNGHGRKFHESGRGHFPQNYQNGYYKNNFRRGKQVGY